MKHRPSAPRSEPRSALSPRAPRSIRPALAALVVLPLSACWHHHDDDDGGFTVVTSTAEIEPNDESASPHFLGVLRPGEEIRVSGFVDAAVDEFDGFAISLTEESEIEFELTFTDSLGELDVWVYDPAVDDIALFFEDDFSPARGVFDVYEPVLDFQIITRAFVGASSYELRVRARELPFFHSSAATVDAPAALAPRSLALAPGLHLEEREGAGGDRALASKRYLGTSLAESAELATEQVGIALALDGSGDLVGTAPVVRTGDVTAVGPVGPLD